jgi:hypothetical protein
MGDIWERFTVSGSQNISIPNGIIARIEIAEVDNSIYQFPAFMVWKLYVEMAKNAESRAIKLSGEFKSERISQQSADKKKIYSFRTPNPDDMLEYFQAIITTYIFSCCALEAYVNLRIDSFQPEEADYCALEQLTKKTSQEGPIKIKKDLLRECSLEEKLFCILPYFLNKKSIDLDKLESFKLDITLIIYVRNTLVHMDKV